MPAETEPRADRGRERATAAARELLAVLRDPQSAIAIMRLRQSMRSGGDTRPWRRGGGGGA